MSIELFVLLVFVVVNIPLAIAIYINNPKSWTNRIFSGLIIILTLYLYLNGQLGIFEEDIYRLFFSRLILANGAILNLLVYLFLVNFPDRKLCVNKVKILIYVIITLILAIITSFSSLTITGIKYSSETGVAPVPGLLMPLFMVHTIGFILIGLIKILIKFKHSQGINKQKIKYVFLAFVLLFFLILVLNFILPVVFKIGIFVPFLPFYILLFLIIVSYAILRHRLLEVRLIVARSVVFTLIIFFIAVLYFIVLFLVGSKFLKEDFSLELLVISVILTMIAVFSFPSLKSFLEKMTDKLFHRDSYDGVELRNELVRIMAYTLRLGDLLSRLRKEIEKEIKVIKSTFILEVDKQIIKQRNVFDLSDEEIKILLSLKNNVIYEELDSGNLKDLMNRKEIAMILVLHTKELGKFGIYLLGHKKSGEIFGQNDIDFLNSFALEVSVAIENSLSYEEIERFAQTLKIKVKEATGKLELANEKLKEMDKLKNEFLNVAAHEMRAPLTAVKGYLSMIAEGDAGKISEETQQYLNGALAGAEREIRLVNNMLNMSRIEEKRLVYNMGEVELSDVVSFAYEEFKMQAKEKGLEFEMYIEKKIRDLVFVDRDRIYEVVANMVSNAIKYTDKGKVTMKLFNPENEKVVRFEVIDTGYGISEIEQKKLFTKFFRSESSAGKVLGTGLGLYIIKLLIENFKGKLGLQSELGKGSVFWFELTNR